MFELQRFVVFQTLGIAVTRLENHSTWKIGCGESQGFSPVTVRRLQGDLFFTQVQVMILVFRVVQKALFESNTNDSNVFHSGEGAISSFIRAFAFKESLSQS